MKQQKYKLIKGKIIENERTLQMNICKYIKAQYPKVIFHMNFTVSQKMIKQDTDGYPDLFIAEPRNSYNGFFLEIKKEGTKLFKKGGIIFKNEHLINQSEVLFCLNRKGYYANFGIGFTECKQQIDNFLRLGSNMNIGELAGSNPAFRAKIIGNNFTKI